MKKKKVNISIVDCKLKKSFIDGPSVLFTFITDNGRLHSCRVPYYCIVLCDDVECDSSRSHLLRGFVNNTFYLSSLDSDFLKSLLQGKKETKGKLPNIFNFLGL